MKRGARCCPSASSTKRSIRRSRIALRWSRGQRRGIFVDAVSVAHRHVALKITAWLLGRKLLFAHAFYGGCNRALAHRPVPRALRVRRAQAGRRRRRPGRGAALAFIARCVDAGGRAEGRARARRQSTSSICGRRRCWGWGSRQAPKACVECPAARDWPHLVRDGGGDGSAAAPGLIAIAPLLAMVVGDSDHARRGARGVAAEPRCLEGRGRAAAGDRGYHAGEVGHLPPAARSGAGGRVHRRSAEGLLDHSPDVGPPTTRSRS